MKAARIYEYGEPSVIKIDEVDVPTIEPGFILIKAYASSINPFDTSVRSGRMKEAIPLELPVTLGGDIAGTVEATGEGVEGYNVGTKVYGQASAVAGNSGAFAEYVLTRASQIARMPHNVNFQEAAAIPLVGASAWQAITQHLKLRPGQKIFIHGGSGGIGSLAIQIAKHIGAYVATTASGEGYAYVQSLGADEVIDYKTTDFTEVLHNFDAVFDTTPGQEFDKSLGILNEGGVAVSMLVDAKEEALNGRSVTTIKQSTHVTTEALDALSELITKGVVRPQVDQIFSLTEIVDAFKAKENGDVQGKIVIQIAD